MIIQFYFQCARMTMNNIWISKGLKKSWKTKTCLFLMFFCENAIQVWKQHNCKRNNEKLCNLQIFLLLKYIYIYIYIYIYTESYLGQITSGKRVAAQTRIHPNREIKFSKSWWLLFRDPGASHQPDFMGRCLFFTHFCMSP